MIPLRYWLVDLLDLLARTFDDVLLVLGGMIMSSIPIEIPAWVAMVKPSSFSRSRSQDGDSSTAHLIGAVDELARASSSARGS
jgi:hypothetical protein